MNDAIDSTLQVLYQTYSWIDDEGAHSKVIKDEREKQCPEGYGEGLGQGLDPDTAEAMLDDGLPVKYAVVWAENGDIVGVYDCWFDAAMSIASFCGVVADEVGMRFYQDGLPVGDWMSANCVRAILRVAETLPGTCTEGVSVEFGEDIKVRPC